MPLVEDKPEWKNSSGGVADGSGNIAVPEAQYRQVRLTAVHSAVSVRLVERLRSSVTEWLAMEQGHGQAFLWLPVALGCGAGIYFQLSVEPAVVPLLAGLVLFLIIAITMSGRSPIAMAMALLLSAMFMGALMAGRQALNGPVLLDSDVTTTITGKVEMREIDADGRVRYLIAVERTDAPVIRRPPERVRLVARAPHEPAGIGGRISGRARLSAPSGPAQPGGYDFAFSAFTDGIGAYGFFFKPPVQLPKREDVKAGLRSTLAERVRVARDAISARIRSVLPGDSGAIAAALTVSDRRGISAHVVDTLRATGLAHILAISGLHMALAAGTLYVGLRRLLALFPALVETWPIKKIAAGGALLAATAYLVISGASIPTMRAWFMLLTMLVAVLLDRPALTMRNVALAATLIILINPAAVTGPGFQMSFAATAGLIAAYGGWARRANRRSTSAVNGHGGKAAVLRNMAAALAGLMLTSLVASVATGLFSAYHFHRIAGYGVLANLLAMPLVSFIVMPAGLAAMLFMPFGLDAFALKAMGLGLEGVIAVAGWVDSLGGDQVVGQLPLWLTAIAAAGFILIVFLRSPLRLAGLAVMLAAGLAAVLPWSKPRVDVIISEDGRLVGLAGNGVIATNAARPSAFTFEQWKAALRVEIHAAPLKSGGTANRGGEGARSAPGMELDELAQLAKKEPGRFACADRDNCVALHRGAIVVTTDEAGRIGAACDMADLVIVSLPVHMKSCRSGAGLVTLRSLRKSGSLFVQIGERSGAENAASHETESAADNDRTVAVRRGIAIASANPSEPGRARAKLDFTSALGGIVRPWTIQRYYDWRSGRFEIAGQSGP